MDSIEKSILKVITYFDVFSYPVTFKEIIFYLDQPISDTQHLQDRVTALCSKGLLFSSGPFYMIRNDAALITRRNKGNKEAQPQIIKAIKIARFLSKFPFINGIAISGSLSKNFSYEGSDLDFFIITKANRLWLAKTIFTVFLKMARLFNKDQFYCLNYFIDEMALEIEEKNIFTATEIITLMPCEGDALFEKFFAANSWVFNYLPNSCGNKVYSKAMKQWPLKHLAEYLLDNRLGNSIDSAILRYYHRKWEQLRKKKIFTPIGFLLGGLIAGKHCCKPFPEHIQKNIIDKFESKLIQFTASEV